MERNPVWKQLTEEPASFLWGYGLLGWFTWEGQYIGLSGGFVIIAVWGIGSILNIHIEMNRIHVLVVSGLLTVIGYLYEGIITKDPFLLSGMNI
ncbi:hypothetical protein P7H06_11565 [Paenibacillus larvae]|nr:hypothetical protein [Paenibacillus larvae]MDT2238153.1 hypothetical protein [Paenibacillus larvae]MDT2260031.1 hypothetical protein [Paenibacillus larvae]